MQKDPATVSQNEKQALVAGRSSTRPAKVKDVPAVNASMQLEARVAVLRVERRLLHRAGDLHDDADVQRHGAQGRRDALAHSSPASPGTGGWEIAEAAGMVENAERIATEAVECCTAKPLDDGRQGSDPDAVARDARRFTRSSRHATELDRVVGYEANYAGTSFVKVVGRRQAEVRLEAVQRHGRPHDPAGVATIGYDDDGVKTKKWPIVREGILVGLQTNREIGALHRREGEPRLHVRQLVARLPVPAHAERPRRAGPGGIARRPTRSSPTRRTA